MCFLWRVVNFNSCIITEQQRDSQHNDETTRMNRHETRLGTSTQINITIISHLSISWVPLLYWGGLGLHRAALQSLLCGDDEEASILKDFWSSQI